MDALSQRLSPHGTIRRRFGHLVLRTSAAPPALVIEAHGYIGPSLLRADLAAAREFGERHPGGWTYVAYTTHVRAINPLNVFWLRRIRALPHLGEYVVVAPNAAVRLVMRLGAWLLRPDRVLAEPWRPGKGDSSRSAGEP